MEKKNQKKEETEEPKKSKTKVATLGDPCVTIEQ